MLVQQANSQNLYTPQWDTTFTASGIMQGLRNATTIGLAINAAATAAGLTTNQTRILKATFNFGGVLASGTVLPVDAVLISLQRGGTNLPAGGGSTKPVVTKRDLRSAASTSTVLDNGGGTPAAFTASSPAAVTGFIEQHYLNPPTAAGQTTHTLTGTEVVFDFSRNFDMPPCTSSANALDSLIFSCTSPADETSTSYLINYTLVFTETTIG